MTPRTPRRWALGWKLGSFGVALAVSAALAEMAFRWWGSRIAASDRLDPGLVQHDPNLGWSLAPSWRGRHRHLDFDVQYAIDATGVRVDPHLPPIPRGKRIAVLGDSFTFGLGVDDAKTFASLLNRDTTNTWWNFGVPGYSTDQECLLLEREVIRRHPNRVVIMLYLANDLLDNPRAVPLQVRAPKPHFVNQGGQLRLENTPVPMPSGEGAAPMGDLSAAVIPPGSRHAWRLAVSQRSALLSRVLAAIPCGDLNEELERSLADELALSALLVRRARDVSVQAGAEFLIVLVPGRSWLVAPKSLSAHYQEFLRRHILADARGAGIRVLDLPEALRSAHEAGGGPLYHAREGHFTPAGHAVVAEFLRNAEPATGTATAGE